MTQICRSPAALAPAFIGALAIAACNGGDSATKQISPAHTDSIARTINSVADAYVAAYFDYEPEQATLAGAPYGDAGRVTDNSLSALTAFHAREDSLLARTKAIDTAGLGDRQEVVTYGILRETLENAIRARVCRNELWRVDASPNAWQAALTEVVDQQTVGTDSLRALAVRRTRDIARFLDTEVVNLRDGLTKGYSAPKVIVRAVIVQIDGLQSGVVDSSAFMSPANRDSSPQFRKQLAEAVVHDLNPAIKRYRDFLSTEYLPKARDAIGVSANPHGRACYRASTTLNSTVDMSADSIHRLGLAQIALIESAMEDIAKKEFHAADLSAFLKQTRHDPKYAFTTRQEIRDSSQAAIARAQAAVPKWFGIIPKTGVVIREYPEFRQIGGAPGEELAPGADGSPAVFLINTYDPTHKSRATQEALAFHEGVPGHGLQTTIAVEQKAAHPIARYFFSSGFGEGWALYSEGLADEMGLYSSPLSRLGMQASAQFRAARLVVDPALHTLGWSRQQAVDYLKAHSAEDDRKIQGEVDRYISWPGQATSYMLGRLEILRLRQMAKDSLGADFDIREFHDQALGAGNISLPILRARVERWIRTKKALPKQGRAGT